MNKEKILWDKFKKHLYFDEKTNFYLDISRVDFPEEYFQSQKTSTNAAFKAMADLEAGSIANPDEGRMVGHYWLRAPEKSPSNEIRTVIESSIKAIKVFATGIIEGKITSPSGEAFQSFLLLGIGGSALGPQFVADALSSGKDKLKPFFIDNTDPDGIEHTLRIIPNLSRTLVLVVSKSGGTPETRNAMLEVKARFKKLGLNFSRQAVAVTCENSLLDNIAKSEDWLMRFPMWDWVGGRTSLFSVVGLLPAALQGFNVDSMLQGANHMDALTRVPDTSQNPAMLLALMWNFIGEGDGNKDMVVLPYRDKLQLLSRYLQQLVMESLGKEKDLDGKIVNQGLSVFGNKGSTDQHAYVQQLREGLNNFFAIFISVLKNSSESSRLEVEPGITCNDFLTGFLLGTRQALYENNRHSISITIDQVNEFNISMLIALFERTVGFYATLINVNAYHQPGVEAGKRAASIIVKSKVKLVEILREKRDFIELSELSKLINQPQEIVFEILQNLSAQGSIQLEKGADIFKIKARTI